MKREQFETYRESEYFNIKELEAQTGQSYTKFANVILKELIDNALDACETANIAPVIDVRIEGNKDQILIVVADNGSGIDTSTIDRILNYQTRTSDKQAYRSPTRGAQGNALKTVFGIPFALSGEDRDKTYPVIIKSKNTQHTILLWLDPTGRVRSEVNRETIEFRGTEITVRVPAEDQEFDPERWVRSFYLFNPHATFTILKKSDFDERNNHDKSPGEKSHIFKATVDFPDRWTKYIPTNPTSPWWYTEDDLKKLVFAYIGEIEEGRLKDTKLRDYLRQFKGLTGAKTGMICKELSDIQCLSDFKNKPNRISDLLAIMKSHTKAASYRTLGMVGENYFRQFFDSRYRICKPKDGEDCQPQFWYRCAKGEDDGIPFIFEIAVAMTEEMGEFFHGVNFSPTYEDPFSSTSFECKTFGEYRHWDGVREFLKRAHAFPDSNEGIKTAVAIHLVCPTLHWTDRGKTKLTNIG